MRTITRMAVAVWVAIAGAAMATEVVFPMIGLTGQSTDRELTLRPVNAPWIYGTNFVYDVPVVLNTVNGQARTNLVPGSWTISFKGLPGTIRLQIADTTNVLVATSAATNITSVAGTPAPFVTRITSADGSVIVTTTPSGTVDLQSTGEGGGGITLSQARGQAEAVVATNTTAVTASLLTTISTASNAAYSLAVSVAKTNAGQRIYNVQAYGAKGDGVTDDSAAIASAWFALTNHGAGVLYFPAGRYLDTNSYDLNTDVYTKTPQGYNLNTFEIAGDGEAASVWLAKITNAAFITMSSAVINMHHLTIKNAGSGVNTGLRSKVTGTVSMRNVTFSGFITAGSIGADFPLTCGGLIDRCEFNYCHIGLRLPSFADGWDVFATIHYNTVGIMVGGSYAFDDGLSVLRANAVKINATGHGNGWPVVISMQSNATKVSGYYEDSTNCVVSIGMPPDFAAERAKETYVGPVQVSDLSGVDTRVPESPAVKVYATNALSLIMRNIMKGDVAVEFANSHAETNMMIDIEGCRAPVIKLAGGKTPQLVNVSFNNGAARRVTWNLQEEHFSFRDWTNAYHAALPWGRLRVWERITGKPFAADGVQQSMFYLWTPSASAARLLYGGGSSETKPVSDHWFYTGAPSAAGAGTVVAAINSAGFKGSGANITNIPISGVTGLQSNLTWLAENTGAGGGITLSQARTEAEGVVATNTTALLTSINTASNAAVVSAKAITDAADAARRAEIYSASNTAVVSAKAITDAADAARRAEIYSASNTVLAAAQAALSAVDAALRQEIEDTTLDLSADEIGNVTNWAKVAPADWRESKATKTLVVDVDNGSDATGARGRLDKPYASLTAASAASAPGDVILIRPGSNYVAGSVWLKTNVTVRGFGQASRIYGAADQTNQAVLAVTNSLVTIEDVWVSAAGTAIGYIGGAGSLAYATNVVLRNVHADGGVYGVAWSGDAIGDGNGHSVTVLMESCDVDSSTNGIGVRILGHTNATTVRMVNCNVTGAWDAVILGGCVAVIEGGRYIATQIDGITTGNYADVTLRHAYVRGGPVANFDLFNDGYPTSVLREDGVDYLTPEAGGDGWDRIIHVPRQTVQVGEVRTGSLVVSNGISASSLTGTIDPARLGSGTANSSSVLYGDNVWRVAASGGGGSGLSGTVSVLDYGADATGATDSSLSISNADWTAKQSNSVVVFPGGTYLVTNLIATAAGWYGIGSNSIIKMSDGATGALLAATNSTIENLTLVGGSTNLWMYGTNTIGLRTAIRYGATGIGLVRNCRVSGFDKSGIEITGPVTLGRTENALITQNWITDCAIGITNVPGTGEYMRYQDNHVRFCSYGIFLQSANLVVNGNNISDCKMGIYWGPATAAAGRGHNRFFNNTINHGVGSIGVCIISNRTGGIFAQNSILGSGTEVFVLASTGVNIFGNLFQGGKISVDNATNKTSKTILFHDNIFSTSGGSMIDQTGGQLIHWNNYNDSGLLGDGTGAPFYTPGGYGATTNYSFAVRSDAEIKGTVKAGSVTATNGLVTSGITMPTNAAPADTASPKAWAPFTNSTGGVFMMPLYQ